MRRRASRWALVLLTVLGSLATLVVVRAVIVVKDVEAASVEPPAGQCMQLAQLIPFERDGPFWVSHRQSLQADISFTDSSHYIVDEHTGRAYTWPFTSMTAAGYARFAVPTRWTWLNPDWKERPWLLLYDCAS
jgi:hypothetical protein